MLKLILPTVLLLIMVVGCSSTSNIKNMVLSPDEIQTNELPQNPIEKAAVQGLKVSYEDSTMWQIKDIVPLKAVPAVPNSILLQSYDPKEVYCVCIEYQARYKVPWSTGEAGNWVRTVRNILVIKEQNDQFLALKPFNICLPFCE